MHDLDSLLANTNNVLLLCACHKANDTKHKHFDSESTSLSQWLQKETSVINSIYSGQVFYNMSLKKLSRDRHYSLFCPTVSLKHLHNN